MGNNIPIENIVQQACGYLASIQQKNGGFFSICTNDLFCKQNKELRATTFFASLIGLALQGTENPNVSQIKLKLKDFFLSQKSLRWSFNYWQKESKEFTALPYPDDLDDTSLALAALTSIDAKLLDGSAMARILQTLVSGEIGTGGPYATWLTQKKLPESQKYVDTAVNANIAYFLSLYQVRLPNMDGFLEKQIESKNFGSIFYVGVFPVIYFISRGYNGKHSQILIDYILSKHNPKGSFGNTLDTTLAITSLLNLGYPATKLELPISNILKLCKNDHWEACPFGVERIVSGVSFFSASSALTTALCIEALTEYRKLTSSKILKGADGKTGNVGLITTAWLKDTQGFPDPLPVHFRQLIQKYMPENLMEFIISITGKFRQALDIPQIPDSLIQELSFLSLYGWLAYTLYDNILDNEARGEHLPVANASLRKVADIYSRITINSKTAYEYARQIMDLIDAANQWEIDECRAIVKDNNITRVNFPEYGNYEKLAQRGGGLGLGPLLLLATNGFPPSSREFDAVETFFRHYIIARQLTDDAHDWLSDLQAGHITGVVELLLKQSSFPINLANTAATQRLYWDKTITVAADRITRHCVLAEQAIGGFAVITDKRFFLELLQPLRQTASLAHENRKTSLDFLSGLEESHFIS